MKKQIFLAALMLGMGSAVLGQTQLKTYDVSDTNLNGEVTVADVTTVANQVVTAAQGQQMVTAEQLNQVLQMIDSRLAALEKAQGISHTKEPDASFDQLNQVLQTIGFRLTAFEDAHGIKPDEIASFALSAKVLRVGETFTQEVTTESDGNVSYRSTNPSVATVDASTGLVTALTNGETTIEVTVAASANYPAASASYTILVEVENQHNGHEYVDLGVVVDGKKILWAKTNMGAEKPADYGDYYAWGETETKSNYSEKTYKYYQYLEEVPGTEDPVTGIVSGGNPAGYQYIDIGDDIAGTAYDVAHVKWQGEWRMPSLKEQKALISQCDWTWVQMKNSNNEVIKGYKVAKKDDSNTFIFLPDAGYRNGSSLDLAGSYGYYWSSSHSTSNTSNAWYLSAGSQVQSTYYDYRYYGRSVRAVCVLSE